MPVCLLCPSGGPQPSFADMGGLTNHISKVHQNVPHTTASPPRQPVQARSTKQCCVCSKTFNSPAALASHQKAKEHYPPRSESPNKTPAVEELASQLQSPRASPPSLTAINGNAPADVPVAHRCNECQANFDSLAQLEAHRPTHKKKIPCSKCSHLSSSLIEWNDHFKLAHQTQPIQNRPVDVVVTPHRSPSPAILRPTSAQSVGNRSASPNIHATASAFCDICKKTFKGPVGLQAHRAAKHPPPGAECIICHFTCPSTTALEEHVDTAHSCAVCHDGILRDAQTLSDHMIEHSHPILCKRCGTRYRTEEDHKLHFSAADNDHPVCVACHLGFEDDDALRAHTNLAHAPSPQPSPKPSSPRFSAEPGVECAETETVCTYQCDICHEACSSRTELDVHIVTVHSCPICHDGIYMDMRSLEEHLEQHRSPYACNPCGLAYEVEDQLLEHYKDSPADVHPHCEKCQLGFENVDAYTTHVDETHPRVACDVCDGELFDQEELVGHYSNSWKHPKCEKCGIGFRDQFDYTDHGASVHPECHCYLCQWHFDTPEILKNHIRHFFNHPKCEDCDTRFVDADAYQYHLFSVHCPRFGDQERPHVSTAEPDRQDKVLHGELSDPLLSARAFDPVWGFEGSASLPYPSFVPLPPSLSGYSSPASQRATENGSSSGSHSRSSTLSVEQRSPTDGPQWKVSVRSLSLEPGKDPKASPEFDHSPLSTLPAVGTPLISSLPTLQSADFQSPFSPRPEPPPLFSLSQGVSDATVTTVKRGEADSDSSSSFTRSPPLVSPVVKLPDPGAASPSSTSSWTMTTDSDSRRSTPHPLSASSSKGTNDKICQTTTSEHTVPQLSLLVPSSTQLAAESNSGCPSSISPESAGISVSASMTPEYLREARAYLSLTHQAQEPASPISPSGAHSPGVSSPILSSTGFAMGEQGRRREVRFEENIISEPVWDRESTSSDSSLDPPVILPRPGLRTNGVSKLPRCSALRRPARRWTNGQANHVPHGFHRRSNGTPPPSYHCRYCYREHCEVPTTTTCGHLFCYDCISTAVMKDARCPVCEAPTLLYCLFRIDTSA